MTGKKHERDKCSPPEHTMQIKSDFIPQAIPIMRWPCRWPPQLSYCNQSKTLIRLRQHGNPQIQLSSRLGLPLSPIQVRMFPFRPSLMQRVPKAEAPVRSLVALPHVQALLLCAKHLLPHARPNRQGSKSVLEPST